MLKDFSCFSNKSFMFNKTAFILIKYVVKTVIFWNIIKTCLNLFTGKLVNFIVSLLNKINVLLTVSVYSSVDSGTQAQWGKLFIFL